MDTRITTLRAALPCLPPRDVGFASSLVAQYDRRERLSEKQWHWVTKLAAPSVPSADSPTAITLLPNVGNMDGVLTLFSKAHEHLKYPKIRLSLPDGSPIALAIAGDRAKFPGSINITDGGRYGENTWYGRVHADGRYDASRRAVPAVEELLCTLAGSPEQTAAAYGKLTGNCCFCHKSLTDERSTDVGYGPVCADNWGLNWGPRL